MGCCGCLIDCLGLFGVDLVAVGGVDVLFVYLYVVLLFGVCVGCCWRLLLRLLFCGVGCFSGCWCAVYLGMVVWLC